MSDSILSNISALRAGRKLNQHANDLSKSFQRLSSGLRINSASDDAAGLAISNKLRTDSRVFNQGLRNANDGISSLSIADGALDEMSKVLIRMRELATQAADGSYSLAQRRALDSEAYQLSQEYNRIIQTTKFNGVSLLAPSQSETRIQLGYGVSGGIGYTLGLELDRTVGSGTFTSLGQIEGGASSQHDVQSADFNGDGFGDFAYANGNGEIAIGLSVGDGSGWNTLLYSAPGATAITLGDFDGDGVTDIAAMGFGSPDVNLLSGNSDGTFDSAITTSFSNVGYALDSLASADFNGDGNLDIAFYDVDGELAIGVGQGNGTFQTTTLNAVSGLTVDLDEIAVGDFNGDGIADLAAGRVGAAGVVVLQGNGNGSFQNLGTFGDQSDMNPVVGDINHDGLDDIVAGSAGNTTVMMSSGGGSFTNTKLDSSYDLTDLALADVNGDGNLDLIGYSSSGVSNMMTAINNGSGTFLTPSANTGTDLSSSAPITAFSVGDYNGDGVLDVFMAGNDNLYLNKGNSTTVTTMQRLDLLSEDSARASFSTIDSQLEKVLAERGRIGANLSRLNAAIGSLDAQSLNSAAAASRITDVDMAEETANMVRKQVLQSATAAVLAQANQSPQIALTLLNASVR